VVALDAATGEEAWYHRVIRERPVAVGANAVGTVLRAPSGAPVWSSPTIDAARGVLYVGTGENYTRPTTTSSDAILALDLATGARRWSFQATAEDAYNLACVAAQDTENCPTPVGPDLDFGMAPILVRAIGGRDILVVGQKSGVVWALDPDREGAVIWSTRVGKGSALGGVHWGMATEGDKVYAANADRADAVVVDVNPERDPSPGLYALDLGTGDRVWAAPAPRETCEGRTGCFVANSAAPSAIPGVVFAGGLDGHIRAHSSADGSVLWDFDTATEFQAVGGLKGVGGAIDGPGPVIAGGMLFVNSGYGRFGQMPGNVLLAFAPDPG
jgi:polyvinyl alcohol dehydrogenase (cytochrome)